MPAALAIRKDGKQIKKVKPSAPPVTNALSNINLTPPEQKLDKDEVNSETKSAQFDSLKVYQNTPIETEKTQRMNSKDEMQSKLSPSSATRQNDFTPCKEDVKIEMLCTQGFKKTWQSAHKIALLVVDKLTIIIIKCRYVLIALWIALVAAAIYGIFHMEVTSDVPKIFSGENRLEEALLLRSQNAYVPDSECYECSSMYVTSDQFYRDNFNSSGNDVKTLQTNTR